MAASRRVLGPPLALAAALLACSCQRDSSASFDDTSLPSVGDSGGSDGSAAGDPSSGGSEVTGGKATGGANMGGKPSAGGANGGRGGGGSAGKGGTGAGGKAGSASGGSAGDTSGAGTSGSAGSGGVSGSGGDTGGSGGVANVPSVYETRNIDDVSVESCLPNDNFGSEPSLIVDGDAQCKVDTLINAPLDAVPNGAIVSQATLTLTCTDTGAAITVSFVQDGWDELSVDWNGRPPSGAVIGTITCDQLGPVVIDLTAAVKAWLSGARKNYGVYLRTNNTDGTDFDSSEAADEGSQPLLSVTYTLPK